MFVKYRNELKPRTWLGCESGKGQFQAEGQGGVDLLCVLYTQSGGLECVGPGRRVVLGVATLVESNEGCFV